MTIVWQNSFIYLALTTLMRWVSASGVARLYYAADDFLLRCLKASVLCTFLARMGRIPAAWESSVTCRALEWVLNAVPALFRRLYAHFASVWEESLVFRTLATLGENVPALLSWFFLAMMLCPQHLWNNLYSLLFVIVGVALSYAAAMRRPAVRLRAKAFNPYLWAFFFLLAAGVLKAAELTTSLRYFTYFFSAIVLALLAVSSVNTVQQLKRIAAFGAAGVPVAAAYGVYQRVVLKIQNTASTVDMELNADMPGRVFSYFENANTFAQVLVMLIALSLGLLFASRTVWGKLGSLVALGSGLLAIVMTYSRASWVGLVAAVFVFVLLVNRRFIPFLILGAVALLPFLPASILNRFLTIFNFSDSSTSSRFPIYEVGLKIWKLNPLIGVGLGSELSAKMAHESGWYHERFKFPHYHNIYLQLGVELGILGVGSYVAGFISSCKETVRALFAPGCDRELRSLTAGCLSGLVGVMVCGMADYFWHYPKVMAIFWLIFGLMLCGGKLATQNKEGTT